LYGSICNERVDVVDASEAPTHRLFEVEQHGDVDEIRATARLVRYSVGARQVAVPGDVYRMPAGAFHRTVVPTSEAATLVFGWTKPGGKDRSVGPMDAKSHRRARRYCDAEESALALRIVAERLDAACAKRPANGLEGVV
jgi:hypothetical protein